jgi:hypothetical protein
MSLRRSLSQLLPPLILLWLSYFALSVHDLAYYPETIGFRFQERLWVLYWIWVSIAGLLILVMAGLMLWMMSAVAVVRGGEPVAGHFFIRTFAAGAVPLLAALVFYHPSWFLRGWTTPDLWAVPVLWAVILPLMGSVLVLWGDLKFWQAFLGAVLRYALASLAFFLFLNEEPATIAPIAASVTEGRQDLAENVFLRRYFEEQCANPITPGVLGQCRSVAAYAFYYYRPIVSRLLWVTSPLSLSFSREMSNYLHDLWCDEGKRKNESPTFWLLLCAPLLDFIRIFAVVWPLGRRMR